MNNVSHALQMFLLHRERVEGYGYEPALSVEFSQATDYEVLRVKLGLIAILGHDFVNLSRPTPDSLLIKWMHSQRHSTKQRILPSTIIDIANHIKHLPPDDQTTLPAVQPTSD